MWATTKGLNDDILKYNAKELNEHLAIRKSDGSEYEPDILKVIYGGCSRQTPEIKWK